MTPILFLLALQRPPNPVRYYETVIDSMPVRVVEANIRDPRVDVGIITADGFPGRDESFESMIQRGAPTVAVDGAYFDGFTKYPISDIRIRGRNLFTGMMGTCLAIDGTNQCRIGRVKLGHATNWAGYQTVLGCGPALILDGKIDVKSAKEGFQDPSIMGATSRMGVGYTKVGNLIIANVRAAVTFQQEAEVFSKLGCYEAMNLDAGASQAMYVNGHYVQTPGRRLTNLLAVWVHDSPSLFRMPATLLKGSTTGQSGDLGFDADFYKHSYDLANEKSYRGTITAGFGLSREDPESGTAVLAVKLGDGSVAKVILGPTSFARSVADFRVGESLQISGSPVRYKSTDFIDARRIISANLALYYRDANGLPLWSRSSLP
jgi:hypothetical protein